MNREELEHLIYHRQGIMDFKSPVLANKAFEIDQQLRKGLISQTKADEELIKLDVEDSKFRKMLKELK